MRGADFQQARACQHCARTTPAAASCQRGSAETVSRDGPAALDEYRHSSSGRGRPNNIAIIGLARRSLLPLGFGLPSPMNDPDGKACGRRWLRIQFAGQRFCASAPPLTAFGSRECRAPPTVSRPSTSKRRVSRQSHAVQPDPASSCERPGSIDQHRTIS
jgi:hypothetical protein